MLDVVGQAIASDKAVKRAQAALDDARAALNTQRELAAAASAHEAALSAEIERVTRAGDVKADILGLHAELAIARVSVEDAARTTAPLGGAVRVHEKQLATATLAVVRKLAEDLRRRTRADEDAAIAALDALEAALEQIAARLAEQARLKAHWFAAGGDKMDSACDLLSLERHEIERLRLPHGPIDALREKFRNVFSRGGRPRRPAA